MIGVFDSGVGGLTVLSALRRALPQADFVYLGDTARVPYGPKSAAVVERYALEAVWYLRRLGAEAIVVACNSASAAAIHELRRVHADLPIFDVIEPGARAAVAASTSGQIGVLGTRGTVASQAYVRAIHAQRVNANVTQVACPLLVPLAEEGVTHGKIAETIVAGYLEPLLKADCDTVVLGCTHYPLLRDAIQTTLGAAVKLVDSAEPLATVVAAQIKSKGKGQMQLFTTDAPDRFIEVGVRFLGNPVPSAQQIDLEALLQTEKDKQGGLDFLRRGLAA